MSANRDVAYECECGDPDDPRPRNLYLVTSYEPRALGEEFDPDVHATTKSTCSYCLDCADLARDNWNGTTAAIELAEVVS